MRFCENCGSELTPGSRFCENCGTPVPIGGAGEIVSENSAVPEENGVENNFSESESEISQGGEFSCGNESNMGESPVEDGDFPAESASEPESGISQGGTFSYGNESNMGESSVGEESSAGGVPPVKGKGDDGVHDWNYDKNSSYSCGSASKGRFEKVVVRIVAIVLIIVAAIIVLICVGVNKAKKELVDIAKEYTSAVAHEGDVKEATEELKEELIEELEPHEEDFERQNLFDLKGSWQGEYSFQYASDDAEETFDYEWYDAKAYIGEDGDGRMYFEVYDVQDSEYSLLSMYIEETEYGFKGVFGHEDAWIYDKYLTKEDEPFYEVVVDEYEYIYMACPYEDEETGNNYVFLMYFER